MKRLVFIVLPSLLISGCQMLQSVLSQAQKPTAHVVGVSLSDLSLQSATLQFNVQVDNPYDVPLPLTNVQYSLASGDKPFLSGAANLQGTIPSHGSQTVTVPATLIFASVIGALEKVSPGAVVPYDATLTLSLNAPQVGTLALPLRHQGQFPVPTVPQIELSDIHWQSLGLESAEALLHLKIRNTNQFPFDLTKLSLNLSLAGTRVASAERATPAAFQSGGEETLEIPVSFSPKNLGLSALELFRGKAASYALDGVLDAKSPFGPLSLPFQKSGQTQFQ